MHISTLVARTVESHLEENLVREFAARGLGDFAIKVGRLQDDPERPAINLMVHAGKPRDDKWADQPTGSRYVKSGMGLAGYEIGEVLSIGEIGGGRNWLRRFSVEGSVFFTRSRADRDTAGEIANDVRGLVETYLGESLVLGLVDDFGEEAFRLLLGSSVAQERGGPKSHIWEFWVQFSVETVRST